MRQVPTQLVPPQPELSSPLGQSLRRGRVLAERRARQVMRGRPRHVERCGSRRALKNRVGPVITTTQQHRSASLFCGIGD